MSLQNKGVNLITILNVYALNNRASKYLKQKLTELKEKIKTEKLRITVGKLQLYCQRILWNK